MLSFDGVVSDWDYVSSGVPQGSVLGPTSFVVFIDDLDKVVDLVNGFVYKFDDDTKYGKTVVDEADREQMQQCIDKLLEWADNWQMEFNSTKCKILHVGNTNPRFTYTMGGYAPEGTILESVEKEKDIGVLIHESLKRIPQRRQQKLVLYLDKCRGLSTTEINLFGSVSTKLL